MYDFLKKHGQTVAFGLGVLITLIFLVMIFSSDAGLTAESEDTDKYKSTVYSFGIAAAILLTILCAVAAVGFGVFQTATNPKGSLRGLIGMGIVAVLAIVGYSIATGTPADDHVSLVEAVNKFQDAQDSEITSGKYKFIGGSILTSLILLVVSVAALLFFGIRSFFK
ncbi:MAG: hypothetical protein AAF433_10570 [Bacteroidota bacterium]